MGVGVYLVFMSSLAPYVGGIAGSVPDWWALAKFTEMPPVFVLVFVFSTCVTFWAEHTVDTWPFH